MSGKVKVEWNSKAILSLIKEMAAEEEAGASRRVFAHAVRNVPVGTITRFEQMGAKKGKFKWFQRRIPGSLLKSIKNLTSKFANRGGGKIVLAGDERLTYYAHFVEFGTVFMRMRRGYRFLRKAILRERLEFRKRIQANLEGDMK